MARITIFPVVLYVVLSFFVIFSNTTKLACHDSTFTPDLILRGTSGNVTIDCESRYSVLLNGTSPGPTIRLVEGKTTWIRVYNDMKEFNLTVVC